MLREHCASRYSRHSACAQCYREVRGRWCEWSVAYTIERADVARLGYPTTLQKESQRHGHFQDRLETYGDLAAGTAMGREKEDEKSYSRVRSLMAQCKEEHLSGWH